LLDASAQHRSSCTMQTPSVAVTLQDIIKQCRKAEKIGFVSSVLSKKFRGTLREVIKIIGEEEAAYKHPFFWALFALVGHGGLLI